jgi:hypothetical protein
MNPKWDMGHAPLVILILFIIAGIIDLGFVVFSGTGSSISNAMINIGFKSPLVVFVSGLVAGHLFFYMTPRK